MNESQNKKGEVISNKKIKERNVEVTTYIILFFPYIYAKPPQTTNDKMSLSTKKKKK